jgi:NAD(P)-dependent dehydrogenase (short-subunit alcohol dehydrogenase family)
MTAARRVVAVTGAGGGIGRAACERLAGHGWSVVAADMSQEKLAWIAGTKNVYAVVADISTEEGNARIVQAASEEFGGLDAIVLNAAMPLSGSIDDTLMSAFDRVLAVNLRGPVLGIRAALPALRARGGGAILVTSSTHGLAGDVSYWAYSASKHGLIGVVKSVAREVGWEKIRINAICPGPTRATGMSAPLEAEYHDLYASIAATVPLQRWGEPGEMAAVIEFLISPDASYVHGATIVVDGGALAGSGLLGPGRKPN